MTTKTKTEKGKKDSILKAMKTIRIPEELIGKKLSKTRIKVLSRPIRASEMRQEVMEEVKITNCLMCSKPFRAVSNINKICNNCKMTEKWRGY